MKCEEIRNLIIETDDLASFEKDRQVLSHVKDCQSCQLYMAYEKNLRAGFAHISAQKMPEQLAKKLASIHTSQPKQLSSGFFGNITKLFSNFAYKTALVSCLIGFFAALLLQNDNVTKNEIPTNAPTMLRARKAEPEMQQLQIAQAPRRQKIQQDASFAPETDNADEVFPAKEVAANEVIVPTDEIPGAISFSIASDQTISSSRKHITLASAKPSAKSRQRAMQPQALLKKAEISPESSFVPQEDPRIAELEQLLNSHAINLKNGKLDLDDLFTRGLLPAEKRSYFSPPPGMDWYVQKQQQLLKVKLAPQK